MLVAKGSLKTSSAEAKAEPKAEVAKGSSEKAVAEAKAAKTTQEKDKVLGLIGDLLLAVSDSNANLSKFTDFINKSEFDLISLSALDIGGLNDIKAFSIQKTKFLNKALKILFSGGNKSSAKPRFSKDFASSIALSNFTLALAP